MQVEVDGQKYVFQWAFVLDDIATFDYLNARFNKERALLASMTKKEQKAAEKTMLVAYSNPALFSGITFCRILVPGAEVGEDGRPKLTQVAEGVSPCRANDRYPAPRVCTITVPGMAPIDIHKGTTEDHFNRYKGRKESLRHAMLDAKFPTGLRQAIWAEFLRRWPPQNNATWQVRAQRAERALRDALAHVSRLEQQVTLMTQRANMA